MTISTFLWQRYEIVAGTGVAVVFYVCLKFQRCRLKSRDCPGEIKLIEDELSCSKIFLPSAKFSPSLFLSQSANQSDALRLCSSGYASFFCDHVACETADLSRRNYARRDIYELRFKSITLSCLGSYNARDMSRFIANEVKIQRRNSIPRVPIKRVGRRAKPMLFIHIRDSHTHPAIMRSPTRSRNFAIYIHLYQRFAISLLREYLVARLLFVCIILLAPTRCLCSRLRVPTLDSSNNADLCSPLVYPLFKRAFAHR